MKTIGVVGGVASGKSRVAQMLVERGAGLLDADRTGHEVLSHDPEVREAIRRRWGKAVLNSDGTPNRSAIGRQVFGAEAAAELEFLENLLHPRIRERLENERARYAAEGRPAAVLDAPLLLEADWGPICDVIVMVDCPHDMRLARAVERGWTEAEFVQREAAQWPTEQKRRCANVTIDNSGSESALRDAVQSFWRQHINP